MDEAYLEAVRDAIQAAFGIDGDRCEVTPDGKAHPNAGEWYYAVHPGSLTNAAQNYRDDRVGLYITVTMRTGFAPQDRVGQNVILGKNGLIRRCKAVAALVHMQYDPMYQANELLTAAAVADGQPGASPFAEPLVLESMTYLGVKGPDWFFAEGQNDAITGLAVQMSFGRARRVQYDESQT